MADIAATILIVDDSRADVRLTQLWLRNSAFVRDVQVVRSGGDALAFLRREGAFAQSPQPHLLLLDVHLPDMMGWDLLAAIRQDATLARLPVIVLTGTVNETDAKLAAGFGVTRYLCKPFDAEEFAALVREIDIVIQEIHPQSPPE